MLDSATDSANSATNATNTNNSTAQISLQHYPKLDYETLSDSEKSEGYVFHILSDFVSTDSRQKLDKLAQNLSKIYPCEINIHIAKDDVFHGSPTLNNNYLTYFRLFIPELLPKDLQKCLYLDVDMLVCADLRPLFALDLGENILGAVLDILGFNALGLHAKHSNEPYYFGNTYFNGGLLLINIAKWRKQHITQECIKFLEHYFSVYHDQDALNSACARKWTILPLQYNLCAVYHPRNRHKEVCYYHKQKLHYSQQEIDFAFANPAILHFTAFTKPWNCGYDFIDLEGRFLDIIWWQTAWETPFFHAELKALFSTKRENYLACKDFGLYVASLLNAHSKNLRGLISMPFVAYRAFSEFSLNRDYSQMLDKSPERSVAFELLMCALRAWDKKSTFAKITRFALLPFGIYKAKNRAKKGIYKAQNVNFAKLYIQSH